MLDIKEIDAQVDNVLRETNLEGLGNKLQGKVRDVYDLGDKVALITTDRHSSFDRVIAHIPFKGQVLTQASAFWFDQTKDIISNHVIEYPDPNVVIGKKYKVVPLEIVPRGYLTGSTATSIWTQYSEGKRDFGNFSLPSGMKKNEKLRENVITCTTKFEEHDRTLTPNEAVEEGLVTQELWDKLFDVAQKLFTRGQEVSAKHGLILVDTKYEFGMEENGELVLIDEIHTPDSSRYWKANTYEERLTKGDNPENFDKEFLRLWFKDNCDPYKDETLPEAPRDMIVELSRRYIEIYETLTGRTFEAHLDTPIEDRLKENLSKYMS